MLKQLCTVTITLMCIAAFSKTAPCADDLFFNHPAGSTPSVFNYGWRGLFIGSLAGLSAGYIRYADDNNSNEMLKSLAYGALTGAGLGLVAGFVDTSAGTYGTGDIILRDTNRGGGFGLAVGLIWGGINAISKGDSKEVGKGAAWGYLGGLVVGLGVAIVESTQPGGTTTVRSSGMTYTPSIAFFQDMNRQLCPGVRLDCRY